MLDLNPQKQQAQRERENKVFFIEFPFYYYNLWWKPTPKLIIHAFGQDSFLSREVFKTKQKNILISNLCGFMRIPLQCNFQINLNRPRSVMNFNHSLHHLCSSKWFLFQIQVFLSHLFLKKYIIIGYILFYLIRTLFHFG